jgi:hypothetical protein
MSEYVIRRAENKDIPFLATAIIAAEKGRSDKMSFSTLFNLTEEKVKELIIKMLEEEIDGCELSVSSFLVADFEHAPIAAFGAWIEAFDGNMPSKILKSNLILNTFDKESIEYFKTKASIIKDILIEREPLTLQLEYIYIADKHIGKGLDNEFIIKSEQLALDSYPALEKVQGQLYKNNILAIIALRKKNFNIAKSTKSNNPEILDYLPFSEKLLMEKKLK